MKKSIKFILTAAVLLSVTIFSFAQKGHDKNHDPEKKAAHHTARMVKFLDLDENQAAEIKTINLSFAQKMKDAHVANKGKDRDAMKSTRAELEQGRSEKIAKVLTPAQLEKYEARKGNGTDRKNMSAEDRAQKHTTRMVEKLSLDDAQAAKVEEINQNYAQKMKDTYKANKGSEREVMKAAKNTLDKSKTAELKTVLTPEQFKTYEEMKAKKMERRKDGKKKARS